MLQNFEVRVRHTGYPICIATLRISAMRMRKRIVDIYHFKAVLMRVADTSFCSLRVSVFKNKVFLG